MYNAEQKQPFIDARNSETNKYIIRLFFDRMEKYEKEKDEDLCNFGLNEIINTILKEYKPKQFSTLESKMKTFFAYRRFCYNAGKIDEEIYFENLQEYEQASRHYGQIMQDAFYEYTKNNDQFDEIFYTPDNLYNYLYDNFFINECQKYGVKDKYEVTDKTFLDAEYALLYVMLLYYGFTDEEIVSLRKRNVGFSSLQENNATIIYLSKEIDIEGKTCSLLKKCVKSQYVYYPRKTEYKHMINPEYFMLLQEYYDDKDKLDRISNLKSQYSFITRKYHGDKMVPSIKGIKDGGAVYRTCQYLIENHKLNERDIENDAYEIFRKNGGKISETNISFKKNILSQINRNLAYLLEK